MKEQKIFRRKLDAIDRRILSILQVDGRITNSELANRIGVPTTSMSDRIRRLITNGYISGFFAKINPNLLGYEVMIYVEVRLENNISDNLHKFSENARLTPEILECYMISGDFDYLIKIRHRTISDFRKFLDKTILSWQGIKEIKTSIVIEEIKTDNVLQILP